jgi:hypothetical protein
MCKRERERERERERRERERERRERKREREREREPEPMSGSDAYRFEVFRFAQSIEEIVGRQIQTSKQLNVLI